MTALQARSDVLWEKLRADGVPNIAIGDLGNEIGMGTIADHIKKYVPFTDRGECQCGCGGGILSATRTDNIITATCSDWGCYGLMAALAYLKKIWRSCTTRTWSPRSCGWRHATGLLI